jgi:hypothetical protein
MTFRSLAFAAAAILAAGFAAAQAAAQSSPLSRNFGSSTAPLGGAGQAPSLWHYGQSYSLYYDKPPAGNAGTGPSYQPSLRNDPYYGPDYVDRYDRGERFGPVWRWRDRHHRR